MANGGRNARGRRGRAGADAGLPEGEVCWGAMRPPSSLAALWILLSGLLGACAAEPPPAVAPPVVIGAPATAPAATAPPYTVSVAPTALPADPAARAVEPAPTAAPGGAPPPSVPRSLIAKINPEAMKQYRIDVCYYGGFHLRRGREDYLAPLGKGKPGPGRIPLFTDLGSGTAGPTPISFEREARACAAGLALADPDFGDVDVALAAYAPVAKQVAADLTAARAYYAAGKQVADSFAEGTALHDALLVGFKDLAAVHDRLGAALAARRRSHPVVATGPGERLARAAVDDALAVTILAAAPRLDRKAFDAAGAKLETSLQALVALSNADPTDVWAKITRTPLEILWTRVRGAGPAGGPRLDSVLVHEIIRDGVGAIESRQRAISRMAMTQTQPAAPAAPTP